MVRARFRARLGCGHLEVQVVAPTLPDPPQYIASDETAAHGAAARRLGETLEQLKHRDRRDRLHTDDPVPGARRRRRCEIRPEPDQALVVFNHPYAYVAHCDVHYADERLAA
jgi:hypothetical protein